MENRHKLLAVLVHLTGIIYIVMIVFSALAGIGYDAIFSQTTAEISIKYPIYIAPAGFTYSIWFVIYIFLGGGAIYSVTTVYRKSGPSSRVYVQPIILNWLFYVTLTANYILITAWIFLWDSEMLVAASITLLLTAFTGWLSFAISCTRAKSAMKKNPEGVIKTAVYKEVRLQRVLVQNGIALYSTWTTVAALINVNIAFQYFGDCDAETTSIVCMSVLLTVLIGWFVLESTWLDGYVRYTLVQYPVIILATSGILSKQYEGNRPDGPVPESVQILTWFTLSVASVQLLARLGIVIYRYRTQPLFKTQTILAHEEILTTQTSYSKESSPAPR